MTDLFFLSIFSINHRRRQCHRLRLRIADVDIKKLKRSTPYNIHYFYHVILDHGFEMANTSSYSSVGTEEGKDVFPQEEEEEVEEYVADEDDEKIDLRKDTKIPAACFLYPTGVLINDDKVMELLGTEEVGVDVEWLYDKQQLVLVVVTHLLVDDLRKNNKWIAAGVSQGWLKFEACPPPTGESSVEFY
ncbi:MAG: hypothetical protein Hyperionvirus1_203 [Hyperionvirus sp.]|uniref:Uncharacterized protein n=1 Tax=Hyperionvirus sp. TaxID=2487770 RepID=A0A3G5A7Y7_9VIRU|nr:MAG: hypothetical protein Hyperionvirus1_203 [Hyperionvirus sp.]